MTEPNTPDLSIVIEARLVEIEAAGQDPEFDRAGLMKLRALLGA